MSSYLNLSLLFGRSFAVSSFLGVVYLGAIEVSQYFLAYSDVWVHVALTFILYILGIGLNYLLQRKFAFRSESQPLFLFFAYNFLSAALVSTLSGLIYSNTSARLLFGSLIESASIVLALLVISPVTFLVFKYLFQPKSA